MKLKVSQFRKVPSDEAIFSIILEENPMKYSSVEALKSENKESCPDGAKKPRIKE